MSVAILSRLMEPGEPLFKAVSEIAKISPTYAEEAIAVLFACFMSEQFKEEISCGEVTESSVRTITRNLLKKVRTISSEDSLDMILDLTWKETRAMILENAPDPEEDEDERHAR